MMLLPFYLYVMHFCILFTKLKYVMSLCKFLKKIFATTLSLGTWVNYDTYVGSRFGCANVITVLETTSVV